MTGPSRPSGERISGFKDGPHSPVPNQTVSLDKVIASPAFARVRMGHLPTPIDQMPRLGNELGLQLFAKRDDCTGIGAGGNKVRQLEFYLGAAQSACADVVLITGAVQSNFVRSTAAMAARLGMGCHIQLEQRVTHDSPLYHDNGNVLLDRLLGATLHSYPVGEDEAGADANLQAIARDLTAQGAQPYVIPLGADHPPLGALGYVAAAIELAGQCDTLGGFDEIFIGSGSALTHCGLLLGLRALGIETPVNGICVRRPAGVQTDRVRKRLDDLATLLGIKNPVREHDIRLSDHSLAPGYGRMGAATQDAIRRTAQSEGLFLDPVYTGKVMAALIAQAPNLQGKRVLFWHTGGQPALFAYADQFDLG